MIFSSSPEKKKLYFNAINHENHHKEAYTATEYHLIHLECNCNCKFDENKLKYNSYHTIFSEYTRRKSIFWQYLNIKS